MSDISSETKPGLLIEQNEKSKKYSKTEFGAKISTKTNSSTKKVSKVFNVISDEGFKIPTPSQSGIWRRVIKEGK